MLDYEAIKSWPFDEIQQTLMPRDAMLYALGIGFGSDPLDRGQLRYIYEKDLVAVPSMAAVLCSPSIWMRDPRSGIDYLKVVHGEQDITVHRPLPVSGILRARARVTRVLDKGPGKGALLEQVRDVLDSSGELLATVRQVTFARGDGGYSALGGKSDDAPAALPAVPDRAPDAEVVLGSVQQAALIYRLSGDYNPLHSDPDVAVKAGFPRPILHGLCTYGMAVHAVLRQACGYDGTRLKRMAARFTSPVFPGETIRFQMWNAAQGGLHLRARVDERDVVVLNNCWFELS
jgi:acyl dehydratase